LGKKGVRIQGLGQGTHRWLALSSQHDPKVGSRSKKKKREGREGEKGKWEKGSFKAKSHPW